MTTAQIIRTAAEIIAVAFVTYGVLNERRFIELEEKVLTSIKDFLINIKSL